MREISTEKVKAGEHVIIDGVEYVAEEYDPNCSECALHDSTKCHLIPCGVVMFKRVEKEPQYRPYKDTEEMIADYKERFKVSNVPAFCMPLIWVKIRTLKSLITEYLNDSVSVNGMIYSVGALFVECTYLDGSPCGKVEG